MSKLLFISHDASLTGAPKSILLIAQTLKNEGHEIEWIIGKMGPRSIDFEKDQTFYWTQDLSEKSLFRRLLYRFKGGLISHQNKLINSVANWKPDLIINNTVVNGDILKALTKLNVPIISRIPEMQSVMAFYDQKNKSTSNVLKYSNLIVAASNDVKKHLEELWNIEAHKIKVFYTGTDIQALPKIKDNTFTISACGTLISRKGINEFILVAKKVIDQLEPNIKVQFQWIGGNLESLGYFEFLEDLRKLSISQNVIVTGEIKDVRPFLQKTDIFLMISKEDPFPVVVLEAISHGVPIVCFEQSGGTTDIVKEGVGVSVPYLDLDTMTQKIIEFADPIVREPFEKKAKEVSISYGPDRIKHDWTLLLKEVLD